jgi:hypothetical protein
MVFPFAIGFVLARPHEPIPITALERPQETHAMCLPASGPSLKLSRQSNIRRSTGLACSHPPGPPPCNFAVLSVVFPPLGVRAGGRNVPQSAPAAPPGKGPVSKFAPPTLLQNCHIAWARVTLLATIASATHALRHGLKFVTLIPHRKLAARVSRHDETSIAGMVMQVSCLADE